MDLDELRRLFLFQSLTDAQLAELTALADEVPFVEDEVLFREGEPADCWWVLLDGRIDLLRRSDHEESVVGALERPGVWAGGFRAWAESAGYMATGRGGAAGRVLVLRSDDLGRLAQSWFPFGVHLIEGFFQTVRNMEALSRQRAGLVALGTLAAGLAHEINNPATAAARAADTLRETCNALLASLVLLAERSLSSEQFTALDALRREIGPADPTDALALADREDELIGWLDERDVEDSWRIAPPLAAAGVDIAWCERAAAVLDEDTLGPGLDWVSGVLTTMTLLNDISDSTQRVSGLVAAVHSYSQLDRAALQAIDVTEGIESTLVVLGHKLEGGITVQRNYTADLPRIDAMPSELNQVWTNLIDNAVDAMDGRGMLRISTRTDGDAIVVDIGDSGPGMPLDVQARAFEPFFTTKDVGKGTGLGLDISRRIIVDRHHGRITIESSAEGTVMSVRLPRPPLST